MRKKVGVITIVDVENYGAELQAFATIRALQEIGYDAELINYPFYKNKRHKATKLSKPVFAIPFKRKLAEWVSPKLNYLRNNILNATVSRQRKDSFAQFHKDNTTFSREYRTIDCLYEANMNYDAYIVGSDQVWNPYNYTSLDPYFLKFAPKDKKKIAYASSFGVSRLPDFTHTYYKDALQNFTAVGVREENAVMMVRDVADIQAEWVLDPTLLIKGDEWDKYANEVKDVPKKYVLIYEPSVCPYVKTLAIHIAKEIGAKVVRLGMDKATDEDITDVLVAGPAEFLWLVRHATFVVTDSFHGTAFSINMNKNFYTVNLARRPNASRQKSLLKLVGLGERLMEENAPLPESERFDIDFTSANKLLMDAREKSVNFLKNAIDGE